MQLQVSSQKSWLRIAIAVLIGLCGSILIWIVTPYNNFVIRNLGISDNYLPTGALFLILIVVMCINPLLRIFLKNFVFDKTQLSIMFGILLVASVIPGQGLMRLLPASLVKVTLNAQTVKKMSEIYQDMHMPPELFPDKLEYGSDPFVARKFFNELLPGESIPWSAWVAPFMSWGLFLLFCWMMMCGLAMLVLPQWKNNERLAFPLLTVQQSLIENPEKGSSIAPLFKSRLFWIAALFVFALHFLAGAHIYSPESIPAIPLDWTLHSFFTEEPLSYLPWWFKGSRIYFTIIGIAFFMPNRISFSIWFFVVAYGVYTVIATTYNPPFYNDTVSDQRFGAMLALTISILWLGRKHWRNVFSSIFKQPASEMDSQNRTTALLFSIGCIGMWAWLTWAGVPALWSLIFTAVGFMVCLLITRIVAETGMPFVRVDTAAIHTLISKFTLSTWMNPIIILFHWFMYILFIFASRVSCSAMVMHALGLNEKASAKFQSRMVFLFLGLFVVGFFIAGMANIHANYHYSASLDGVNQPLVNATSFIDRGKRALMNWKDEKQTRSAYNNWTHIGFGASLAAGLQAACLVMPKWPLHPIGLLMVNTWYAMIAWVSIFAGWLIKILLIRFGGSRLYQAAKPIFLGLIMGEVFAAVFWCIVPFIMVNFGESYIVIPVLPSS